jgi:hypothetical protein
MLGQFWLHLTAYALLLAAVTAVIPLDGSFGGDDGAYGGQVFALQEGHWSLDRPLPVVRSENEGWLNTAITPDGPMPYTSNPGYPLLLQSVGEPFAGGSPAVESVERERAPFPARQLLGLQLVPVVGALASAAVAWALARRFSPDRIDRGPAALAFWLVALGPVLVNSTTLWAHTLSTALGAGSVWFLTSLARSARSDGATTRSLPAGATLGLGATLTSAAMVRTEAVFWIIAIAVTAAVVVRTRLARLGAAVAIASGLVAWLVNRSWGAALRADRLPVDTAVVSPDGLAGWAAGRLPAAWRLLLTSLGGGVGPLVALVAIALAVFGAVLLRRGKRLALAVLLVSAACYPAHALLAPRETISGTLAAWPVVVVLIVAGSSPGPLSSRSLLAVLRSSGHRAPDAPCGLAVAVIPAVLLTCAVLATQYSISGGHQWGGRYLSLAFAPIAVTAALVGWPVVAERRHRTTLIALLVAPAIAGVLASYQLHTRHRDIVTVTTSIPAEVVVTEVVALPRIAWTDLPTAYYVADADTVGRLLEDLAAARVGTVNLHGLDEVRIDGTAGYVVTSETDTIRHLELAPRP